MVEALVVATWVACGVLAWGLTLGSFTYKWPYMRHTGTAFMCLLGPAALLVALLYPWFNGEGLHWRLRPLDKEARWGAFKAKGYEILGRDYFEQRHG